MNRKTDLILLLCCFIFLLKAEPHPVQEPFASHYTITHMTMEDGLLHNNISDIYKDKLGFIWISTKGGGLSRFDGYGFTHFNANTSRVNLSSNFIATVCEDDFHRLWIASDEGTDILNLHTLQLELPDPGVFNLGTILSKPSANVLKDHLGNIWLFSGSSLYKIGFDKKGKVVSVSTLAHVPAPASMIALNDIDKDGNIWIGYGNNLCKIKAKNADTLQAVSILPPGKLETRSRIHALYRNDNEVWIGSSTGLYRYNLDDKRLKRYLHDAKNPRSISQNYITDIITNNDKQLLISTFQGINIYNPLTDDFERISKGKEQTNNSLHSDFITSLFADDEIIWIGSDVGGVNKMIPRKLSFYSYIHDPHNPHSLSQNPVNSIYEDSQETLWVGTVEGGLNKMPKGSRQFTHYTTTTSAALSHNTVSSILADNQERLWVGTWGWGITLLDLKHPGNRVLKYITPAEFPGFSIAFIESLCYDSINNGVWIGANPGIFFYDFAGNRLINPFTPDLTHEAWKALGTVIDSHGKLWIGSVENGLFIIDLHSRKQDKFSYRHLKYKLDKPESGAKERITCLYKASDGTIWIGSNGNGFYKYNYTSKEDGTFTGYSSKEGLINNNIRGILEDDNGFIWISTNYGLSCFDQVTETFTNYTREDGLINNQFYWNASCKSQSGDLYFGGTHGLTVIDSRLKPSVLHPFKVIFTRLHIKNEEVSAGEKGLRSDISITPALRIHEKDNSFSLEFSSLDYKPNSTAIYSYRLLGFDDKWIDIPANRRFANYTNIPPGHYTFQVKYTLDGKPQQNPHISELQIVVTPFFYKTWWFIAIMILLAGSTVIYIYLRRLHFLQKQKKRLYQMVEERTRELTEQNRKINRQKAQLLTMSTKIQELTLDKLSFFTNITHEFRTPITLITGPVERALKLSRDPRVTEQLHFVERNSKYLLSLVNQLMDFRKIESGKQEILKVNADFLSFIDSLLASFEGIALERSISIKKYYRISNPVFLFDRDAIQKILINLVSNAIKFTPDGGNICIYAASIWKRDGQEKLFICVKDTGTGIEEGELSKIFHRFYQSRKNTGFPLYGQSSTGIGLYLVHRIVQLQKGKITAFNNKTAGSSFRILLPMEREQSTSHSSLNAGKQPNPSPDSDTSAQLLSPDFKPGKLTLLIVEDNKDMRKYIHSILVEYYNLLEAENGAEALETLTHNHIDFVVSDLMMPVMDGIELSRKVKQNFTISHIPILMLTAKTSQETRLESFRTGVDEYIQKPFSEELLLTRIRNILENRKRYQQRFASNMEVKELQIDEKSKDKIFIDKLMEVIRSNYSNSEYGIPDFSRDMGISKNILNKKMQNVTGQSTGQFIRNYRLNIAYEFLKKDQSTHAMNIAEVAYKVGFNDPKYFTRCFTRRYRLTPSQVKEEKSPKKPE